MEHRCTVCQRLFPSRDALKGHIGGRTPDSAVVHQCGVCEQRFCSESAVQQHQDALSHASPFACGGCRRIFRLRQSFEDHQKATGHSGRPPVSTTSNSFWTSSNKPLVRQGQSEPKALRTGEGPRQRWKLNPETGRMMDTLQPLDWVLCDKDCGWCGHCSDSYVVVAPVSGVFLRGSGAG
jgi:hypothetical protein